MRVCGHVTRVRFPSAPLLFERAKNVKTLDFTGRKEILNGVFLSVKIGRYDKRYDFCLKFNKVNISMKIGRIASVAVLFLCKNIGIRREWPMFNDEVLEMIFSHEEMQKIPIGAQSTAVMAIGEVLEAIKEERPYAAISELFSDGLSKQF